MSASFPPVSPFLAGLKCRCPRCGAGRLFAGFLTLVDKCAVCDLDLADANDVKIVGNYFVGGIGGCIQWLDGASEILIEGNTCKGNNDQTKEAVIQHGSTASGTGKCESPGVRIVNNYLLPVGLAEDGILGSGKCPDMIAEGNTVIFVDPAPDATCFKNMSKEE